ncbi:DUF975 family protein [Desemzia sp. RIT804]|uniref:DUF975 family protein n=1 Tax=Desemzia sp. RIT 804 TaxID=2810209 RepID=UPI00195129A4|nr:DUF975 family protein [Desemzia sp. RIT 804]MBM6615167.1 DUF975 family protein [Desemzia sp. RIT 804]
MNEFKTSAELKQDARDMLKGRWKDAVLMNFIPTLIIIVALVILVITIFIAAESFGFWSESTSDSYFPGNSSSGTASGIFSAFITAGISFTFLNAFRDASYKIRPLKDAFQAFSKKYFLGVLLVYIISSLFTFLWTLLFIIPGIIKSYAYSQAYLIYKDHVDRPDLEQISALDCITESKELMQGHKMRFFLLGLSFLGWILIGVLTLGIGFLWITPYMVATNTAFYHDLVGDPSMDNEWETDDEWDESDF